MQLPGPVRATVGLLAIAADEARRLPDRAIELPMLAVSTALQVSMRAQQRYAQLTARGDDVLNRRTPSSEPPPWATFDPPPPDAQTTEPESEQVEPATGEPIGADADATDATPPANNRTSRPNSRKSTAKKVNRPRHTDPSPFDVVDDSE